MPTPKKLFLVAGARPNFMKIAPIVRELAEQREHFDREIVYTGQHYDEEMSDVFFEELEIPKRTAQPAPVGAGHARDSDRSRPWGAPTTARQHPRGPTGRRLGHHAPAKPS